MYVDSQDKKTPLLLYYEMFHNILAGKHELSPMHRSFFGHTKSLAAAATISPKTAGNTTRYVATLQNAGYCWQENLLLKFSDNLITMNKKNPEELRKLILIHHVAEVAMLFNGSINAATRSACLDTIENIDERCPEMKKVYVKLDNFVSQNERSVLEGNADQLRYHF